MHIRTKVGLGALLPMAAATILVGCSTASGLQPAQTTANQFLTALSTKKPVVAYGLLTAQCRAVTSQQQMQNYWDLVEKNRGKVMTWTQLGFNMYSGTGGSNIQLNYQLTCAKGQSSIQFTLVPEGKNWRIQGSNVQG